MVNRLVTGIVLGVAGTIMAFASLYEAFFVGDYTKAVYLLAFGWYAMWLITAFDS